ncbi:MAG: hypothetical protein BWY16_00360 [Candidatus Omnitrophica bacterium ADurb.Bin205]|nr:MAG: hypothetical protein BWY16_00360 [Candidatus Omnitrophica bacterium ADurb.Bin205]
MDCSRVRELLSGYMDQALDLETSEIVRKHLLDCKLCSEELAVLKGCVKEILSLKQVKAPENFLQMVHERIERDFEFKKIVHKFFIPLKVKIPLELVGVLGVVFLVIMVNRAHQPLSLRQPVSFTPEANQSLKGLEDPRAAISPVITSLNALSATARTGESFYLSQGAFFQNALPVYTAGRVIEGGQSFELSRYTGNEYNKEFPKIANIVESLGGAITFVHLDKETRLLESLTVRIPSNNYPVLLDKLKEISLVANPRLSVIRKDEESTELSIELLPSR